MRKHWIGRLAALAVVGLTAAACDSDTNTGLGGEAELRAVHLSPDGPAVDIVVNGAVVAEDVTYTGATDYLTVSLNGPVNVQVRAAGTATTVINETLNIANGARGTVLAVNTLANIEALAVADNWMTPGAGQARLRVIHGAPSVDEVDVYVTAPDASIDDATPVLEDVPFKGVSNYLPVTVGTYRVRVTPANTKTVAIDVNNVALESGAVYTAIARETAPGGAPFTLLLLEDN